MASAPSATASDHASTALGRLRTALLAIVVVTSVGTLIELLLIGHTDDAWQYVPLVLLTLVTLSSLGLAVRPTGVLITAFRVLMTVCVLGGVTGQWLHYRGNAEFEREVFPNMVGLELFRESMSGATPVLAAGTLSVIGVLGLLYAWRPRE